MATTELGRVLSHFHAVDGKAECPFCHHHSLTIDSGKDRPVLIHCFNCPDRQAELAKIANTVSRDVNAPVHKVNAARPTRREWTEEQLQQTLTAARHTLLSDKAAQKFLADRGIPLVLAQCFGLGSGEYYYEPRIVIPYFDGVFGESVLQLRYRQIRSAQSKVNKWRCEKRLLGGRRLFNLPLLLNWDPHNTQPLVITESELDCMMLSGLDVQAISVDTAGHRLVEQDLTLLRHVKNLILAFDQDEAGAKCTARFKQYLPAAKVLGGYAKENVKDLGDLRAEIGSKDFEARLRRFLERRTA
jgi:DNA primase